MSLRRASAVSILFALLGMTGDATQAPRRSELVDVARVVIDARAVDDSGDPLLGLTPDDFAVRIDGELVRVESAQWIGGDTPRDAVGVQPPPSVTLGGVLELTARGRWIVFVVQKSMRRHRLTGLLRLLERATGCSTAGRPADCTRGGVLSRCHRCRLSHPGVWSDGGRDGHRGFFARTHLFARRAIDRVRDALVGHYVLFAEKPPGEPGTHLIEVELVRHAGSALARRSFTD